MTVSVIAGQSSMFARGRTDFGSEELIVSSIFAEKAVAKGIGKMEIIYKVTLWEALKTVKMPNAFHFLEAGRPPTSFASD